MLEKLRTARMTLADIEGGVRSSVSALLREYGTEPEVTAACSEVMRRLEHRVAGADQDTVHRWALADAWYAMLVQFFAAPAEDPRLDCGDGTRRIRCPTDAAGCRWCCRGKIECGWRQAASIARLLPEHLVARVLAYERQPDSAGAWCPMLDQESGLCLIYEIRPAICRTYCVLTPPDACAGPPGTEVASFMDSVSWSLNMDAAELSDGMDAWERVREVLVVAGYRWESVGDATPRGVTRSGA